MKACPSSSPLANTGTLSVLWVQISQVPSVVAFHFTGLSELFPPPLMNGFLVPQAVSTLPIPAHSQGLTTRAEVSMPSPKPSISVFGDCASSSDDLFSSHSAFQMSDLLLRSSQHLEFPPLS